MRFKPCLIKKKKVNTFTCLALGFFCNYRVTAFQLCFSHLSRTREMVIGHSGKQHSLMQHSRLDQKEQWNCGTLTQMALLLFAYLLFTPKSLKLLTQLPASKIYLDTPSYCTVQRHCNQYCKNYIYRAAVGKGTWMCSRKFR